MSKIFSVLEEHTDGSMWHHPGWSFKHEESAINFIIQKKMQQSLWFDRYMELFIHNKPLPQDRSVWTTDGVNFQDRSGATIWNKDKGQL